MKPENVLGEIHYGLTNEGQSLRLHDIFVRSEKEMRQKGLALFIDTKEWEGEDCRGETYNYWVAPGFYAELSSTNKIKATGRIADRDKLLLNLEKLTEESLKEESIVSPTRVGI